MILLALRQAVPATTVLCNWYSLPLTRVFGTETCDCVSTENDCLVVPNSGTEFNIFGCFLSSFDEAGSCEIVAETLRIEYTFVTSTKTPIQHELVICVFG